MARLLIIEDGVALASLLVSATSDRGHLASAYDDGTTGLQAASEERFDLAIVDLLLPDLRGAEVLERLRALGVPTIAMSGVFKGDRFARDAVERHGALAFFEKPFALDRLLDTIDAEVLRENARDAEAVASLETQAPAAATEELATAEGAEGDEALDLDFEVEVEMPTAEIHLDHPTTELELNPEALEAFQEALEHSAGRASGDGVHDLAPPTEDTAVRTSEFESAPEVGPHPDDEDPETSFAGVLNDDPEEAPAVSQAPVEHAAAPAVSLPDSEDAAQASVSDATASAEARSGSDEEDATTDEEVTAPSPPEAVAAVEEEAARVAEAAAEAGQTSPADVPVGDAQTSPADDQAGDAQTSLEDVPVSDAQTSPADVPVGDAQTSPADVPVGDAQTSLEDVPADPSQAGASAEDEAGAITLLPSDVIPDAASVRGGNPLPEIPADVSEHIDHSLGEAAGAVPGSSPHTPFSERAAVWEGEPVGPNVRSRALPPPEGSLGEHGLYGLLNACHQSRFTGTLHVESEGQRILTLVDGQLADIGDPGHPSTLPSIAELSVQDGAIDEELLEEVRELAGHEGLSEDEALVLMGVLTPDQLSVRARARLRPLLAELLGWTDGQLRLTAGTSDAERSPGNGVPLAPIIFEAILARGEDALAARELSEDLRLAPTEDPPYDLGEIPLSGAQAQLLAHSDGSKRIADLSLLSDLDARDVRLTLWALVRLGILAPMHPTRSTRRITFGL